MRQKRVLLTICRLLLAATFIFSGFVKSVDPWGTAIKISEYFDAFGIGWLSGWKFGFAIWLTGAELMLGLMLLFKVRMRIITIFASLSMLFFTGLTLVLAIWNPVEDCGCFGDAIKLTNWQTFIKNMVLLPMSLILWWSSRHLKFFPFTRRELITMTLIACVSGGVGVYSFCHLPLIDFLPYKVGTNLRMSNEPDALAGNVVTTLIYRDKSSGKTQQFDLSDTTWYDSDKWEYVDTETVMPQTANIVSRAEFTLIRNGEFVTDQILGDTGTVYMICAENLSDVTPHVVERLQKAAQNAVDKGYSVICLTATPESVTGSLSLGENTIACYNMDATSLKTMIRAKVGIVVLHDGMVIEKCNWRDLPR